MQDVSFVRCIYAHLGQMLRYQISLIHRFVKL